MRKRYQPLRKAPLSAGLLCLMLVFCCFQQASAQKKILFIYNPANSDGSTDTNGNVHDDDNLYLTILEDSLGYQAVLADQNTVSPADTAGVDAVFISESVGSGTIVNNFISKMTGGAQYANLTIPIITPEAYIWDDMQWMKMGQGYGDDLSRGFTDNSYINILPGTNPILGGLRQGPVVVYDAPPTGEPANQVGFTVPQASATILATVSGNGTIGGKAIPSFPETRATLFTYDTGDKLIDSDTLKLVAKARRVGFFAHTRGSENMNSVGQKLFRNAIAWALGDTDKMVSIDADPYKVLFIYNPANSDGSTDTNGNIHDDDVDYLTILEDSLGYEAVLADQNTVSPADTAGVDAVFISESVGSGTTVTNFIGPMTGGAQYANLTLPVVTPEAYVWDDMLWMKTGAGFADDSTRGFAQTDSIVVSTVDNPITYGLQVGPVDVYNDPPTGEPTNQVGFAVPQDAATVVATIPDNALIGTPLGPLPTVDQPRAAIFTYNTGDTLVASDTLNLVAKNRRASFFAHTRGSENMDAVGRTLFINTMLWATGRDSEVRMITASGTATQPEGELPRKFAIQSIYPNPFNSRANVLLDVQEAGRYEMHVYDVLGREVDRRSLGQLAAGTVRIPMDLSVQASGLYLVQVKQLETGHVANSRAVLVK